MDLGSYKRLILVMITPSHERNQQAVDDFDLFKQTGPDTLALRLAKVLGKSTDAEIRAMSAILFRELIEEPLVVYTQNMVKYILLRCVKKEKEIIVRKSLCHTIAMAFNVFCSENRWPKLFYFIGRCVSGRNDLLHEIAMLMLANLLEQSTNVEIRARSAILLKELIGKMIAILDVPTENLVKDILLRCIEKEDDRNVRKSLCHAIAKGY
ncbi:importin-5-like protein [Tanacetum coccineum]